MQQVIANKLRLGQNNKELKVSRTPHPGIYRQNVKITKN